MSARARVLAAAFGCALCGCVDFSEERYCEDYPEVCKVEVTTMGPTLLGANRAGQVRISGRGFGEDAQVLIDGAPAYVNLRSKLKLVFMTPAREAGEARVAVVTGGRTVDVKEPLRWVDPPVVDAVTERVVERDLFVHGRNFVEGTTAFDGDQPLSIRTELSDENTLVIAARPQSLTIANVAGEVSGGPIDYGTLWQRLNPRGPVTSLHTSWAQVIVSTTAGVQRSIQYEWLRDLAPTWGDAWTRLGNAWVAGTDTGLQSLDDSSIHWVHEPADVEPISAVAATDSPARLYAVRKGGVFWTSDLGKTWTAATGLTATFLLGAGSVLYLGDDAGLRAVDVQSGATTVLSTDPVKVMSTRAPLAVSDGTQVKLLCGSGLVTLPVAEVTALSGIPSTPDVLVGTPTGIVRGTCSGVVEGDGTGLPPGPVGAVAADDWTVPPALYVYVEGSGLYRKLGAQ